MGIREYDLTHRMAAVAVQPRASCRVTFWSDTIPGATRQNRDASDRRFETLMGEHSVVDPLEHFDFSGRTPKPFRVVPSSFLQKARRNQPKQPIPTASAFSSWVYSLYGTGIGTEDDLQRGRDVEQEVLELKRSALLSVDDDYLRFQRPGWRLIHDGISTNLDGMRSIISLPTLAIKGAPLRVSPDLVYFHEETSKIIIVEVKSSYQQIPSNLWPNIWAQLWCYAHMEKALTAASITVVGEVWADRLLSTSIHPKFAKRHVSLRASVKRDPRAPSFDRFFRELFRIYSRA